MTSKTATISSMHKGWDDPIHITNYYKTETCKKFATRTLCDYTFCPYYHGKKERRRSFETYSYTSQACEHVKLGEEWKDSTNCPLKDECPKCHTRMEQQFHPEVYKKMQCKDLQTTGACPRGAFCAFAHHDGEIQGKRNPEWNFDWSKILPAGVSAQYNTTKKGCGKKVVDVIMNNPPVAKPMTIIPPPSPSPWSGGGSSIIRKLLSSETAPTPAGQSSSDNKIPLGPLTIANESSKIPGRLPYTFAAILAGKHDDTHSSENNNAMIPVQKNNVAVVPLPEAENEAKIVETTKHEEPIFQFTRVSNLGTNAPNKLNFAASFADILSGARSRSETLPNRIGSLNSLTKKPSVEIDSTCSPSLALLERGEAKDIVVGDGHVRSDSGLQHEKSRSPTPSPELSVHCTCGSHQLDVFDDDSLQPRTCDMHADAERSRERTLSEEYEDVSDLDVDTVTLFDSSKLSRKQKKQHDESVGEIKNFGIRGSSSSSDTSVKNDNVFATDDVRCEKVDTSVKNRVSIGEKKDDGVGNYSTSFISDTSMSEYYSNSPFASFDHLGTYSNLPEVQIDQSHTHHGQIEQDLAASLDFAGSLLETRAPSTQGGIRPPPGFACESAQPPKKAKTPDYATDLFDEDFWVPLEEYATRYKIQDGDFANIVENVQRDQELRNSNYTNNNRSRNYPAPQSRTRSNQPIYGSGDGHTFATSSSSYYFQEDGNRNNPIMVVPSLATSRSNPWPTELDYFEEEQLVIDVAPMTPAMERELASLFQRTGLVQDAQSLYGALSQNSPWDNSGEMPSTEASSTNVTSTPRAQSSSVSQQYTRSQLQFYNNCNHNNTLRSSSTGTNGTGSALQQRVLSSDSPFQSSVAFVDNPNNPGDSCRRQTGQPNRHNNDVYSQPQCPQQNHAQQNNPSAITEQCPNRDTSEIFFDSENPSYIVNAINAYRNSS